MFMYQQLEEAGGAATGTTGDVNGNENALYYPAVL